MNDPSKAVFLSYASQDAEAARRICEALRAGGVEVWFDADGGLEHGDEWDAKIRRQVKECVLFIPIISANTQAREEGYFRIEWDLAAERARGIASGVAFILPVVIDDTREPDALVPDRFRSVQWTRLRNGEVSSDVQQRFLKLWSHRSGVLKAASAEREVGRAESGMPTDALPQPAWKVYVGLAVVCLAIAGGAVAWLSRREAVQKPSPAAGPVPAPISESRQLVARARALIDDDLMAVRENFRLADEFSRRAVALDATDGEAWATAARVSALMLQAKYEMTPERRETAKTQVERAGRLAPVSIETGLALATYLEVNNDPGEAERLLRRLIQQAPADKRLWRSLATNLANNGRYEEALATLRQPAGLLEEDPQAQSLLAYVLSHLGRYREEQAVLDRVLQRSPTKLAYYYQLVMLGFYRSDLAAASRTLEKIPAQLMQEDSMINSAAEIWLRLGEGEKALQVLQKSPRDFLEEGFEVRPKGFLTGAALQLLGRPTAASAEWRQALVVVENRLVGNPNQPLLLYWKAVLQALTGQKVAALDTRKLYREFEAKPNAWFDAILLVAVGENEQAIQGLERAWPTALVSVRSEIRNELLYGPWLAAIRADPRMQRLISEQTATIERDRAGPIATSAKIDDKSVAVLAFANLSDDKANEYFSDGISEELLNVLAKVPGLKVSARTSAFYFKGKEVPIPEIAKQLGVAYVVEGSVRKQGDKVRITAQLIKAADGFHVWSDTFTRELKDIFAVQDEIAGLIAQNLQLKIGAGNTSGDGSTNIEAWQLYLDGRRAWNLRTREGYREAETLFQRTIDLDNRFARAYAALADVWQLRAIDENAGVFTPQWRTLPTAIKSRTLIDKALEIDPRCAEAYASLGMNLQLGWQDEPALQAYRRAIELNPNYATAHQWLGLALLGVGKMDESLSEVKQATELDPLSHRILSDYAKVLNFSGHPEEALVVSRRALAIQPGEVQAVLQEARALARLGLPRETAALVEGAEKMGLSERMRPEALAILALAKQPEAIRRLIGDVDAVPASTLKFASLVALGRIDEAFANLESGMVWDGWGLSEAAFGQLFEPIRRDPRFQKMIETSGRAEYFHRAQAWRAAQPPAKTR